MRFSVPGSLMYRVWPLLLLWTQPWTWTWTQPMNSTWTCNVPDIPDPVPTLLPLLLCNTYLAVVDLGVLDTLYDNFKQHVTILLLHKLNTVYFCRLNWKWFKTLSGGHEPNHNSKLDIGLLFGDLQICISLSKRILKYPSPVAGVELLEITCQR